LPAKPGNVSVKKELNCRGLWLYGNETQLSQLLLNLILNAFHAMAQAGGVLTLSTERRENEIVFSVSDTGSGIPEEIREHIFDPFFTTKESGAGTGLGLAIAQQVVSEHNGRITLDSTVGEGTTFSAIFPLSLDREREQED